MFEWLLLLLTVPAQVTYAEPPQKDYLGMVAAEVAYASLLPNAPPVKPQPVDPKNCPTCKGAGKVPSGDGQGWTKCPTCTPISVNPADIKVPKSDPTRYQPVP